MIGELCIMFQGAQLVWAHFLHLPLLEVLLNELFTDIKPQHGMVCNVVPAKPGLVWQPGIDIPHQDIGELTGLLDSPTIEGFRDMVLPILEQYGHPCPKGGAPDTNVPKVDHRGREWQLPLSGIIVCINSGMHSHLGMGGTGNGSCNFQCCVPHSMVAKISAAYHRALVPKANRHLTVSS